MLVMLQSREFKAMVSTRGRPVLDALLFVTFTITVMLSLILGLTILFLVV